MICINWFMKMWRSIMGGLDFIIYQLVSWFAKILMSIADITISNEVLGEFTNRVYIVLGLFMLFKVSFSLLNAIVNPDALTDKENGMQKVASRIVIALILLILTPTIFSKAMELQSYILPAVPKLILGQTGTESQEAGEMGEEISAVSWKSFFSVNEKCTDSKVVEDYEKYDTLDGVGTFSDLECGSDNSEFAYDYSWGISAIAGLFLAFIFLTYCLDVAVRAIKLAILQLIAPIPVISYIEPKSAKSGMFSKWIKSCISTYAELFIKLAVIYLCIFLASQVVSGDAFVSSSTGEALGNMLNVVLIIGIFLFAKQAPKFLGDIFGIEISSTGSILGKALGWLGGGLAAFGGAALGAGFGGIGGLTQGLMQGAGLRGSLSAGLSGMGAGAAEGTKGISAGLHQFRNQSNEIARALTGDRKYETGFTGMLKRKANSAVKLNQQRAQYHYDNKWKQRNIDQRSERGYGVSYNAENSKGFSLTGTNGFSRFNDQFNNVANELTYSDEDYQKLQTEYAFAVQNNDLVSAQDYVNQMASVVESKMVDPNSQYFDRKFASAVNNRDRYAARANAQSSRDQSKAAKDAQKSLEQALKDMGYDKKK